MELVALLMAKNDRAPPTLGLVCIDSTTSRRWSGTLL